MKVTELWISVKDEYLLPTAKAQCILISFATSYLCNAGFSAVAAIKKQVPCKNQCGTGNEGGGVQSNSKV